MRSEKKTVITSFSRHGYEVYGRKFLDTFDRHWPKDVGLRVYIEPGQTPLEVMQDRPFSVVSIDDIPGWVQFSDAIDHFPLMQGDTGKGYSIQYDARMARKPFMQDNALNEIGGRVFWLDADTLTHADIPQTFIDDVLPPDKFCCFLGRRDYYTESGFLGFNEHHFLFRPFFAAYLGMFKSGHFLRLSHWHDCTAFDAIREQAPKQDAFVNLGHGVNPGPGMQVFINSRLGAYMDHLKGPRKERGHSPLSDLTVSRTEPYWQTEAEPMVQTR